MGLRLAVGVLLVLWLGLDLVLGLTLWLGQGGVLVWVLESGRTLEELLTLWLRLGLGMGLALR